MQVHTISTSLLDRILDAFHNSPPTNKHAYPKNRLDAFFDTPNGIVRFATPTEEKIIGFCYRYVERS